MKVSVVHPFTGVENTLDLDVTQEELDNWIAGENIRTACPRLSVNEREFLISGLLPGEFEEAFPEEEGIEDEFIEGRDDISYDDHFPERY